MKYQFILEYRCYFKILKMCRALQSSPSGYYTWLKRPLGRRKQENERLLKEIRITHDRSRKTYGSPRVTAELKANGISCSRHRVAPLMPKKRIGDAFHLAISSYY